MSLYSNKRVTKTELGTKDWGIAVTGLTMLFVRGIQTIVRLCTRNSWMSLSGAKWDIPIGIWKTVLRAIWTEWDQVKRFQKWRMLVSGSETILVIFWQEKGDIFVFFLKIFPSLNWRVLYPWHWQRFQNSQISTLSGFISNHSDANL